MSQSTVHLLATSATTHKPRNLTRQPLKPKQLVHQCMVSAISRDAIACGVLILAQGDPQGVALVAELCEPERPGKSGHFVVAALSSTNIDTETFDYLKKRGCFDLPALDIQQTLVQAYFHYVHPFFPVVHVSSFLKTFESPGQNGVCLHLLWSVFLAATNVGKDPLQWVTSSQSSLIFRRPVCRHDDRAVSWLRVTKGHETGNVLTCQGMRSVCLTHGHI